MAQGMESFLKRKLNKRDLGNEKEIIVYGAGSYGQTVMNTIFRNDKDFVCYAVSEGEKAPSDIGGIPVYYIDELKEKRENALLLISVLNTQALDEMTNTATLLGFRRIHYPLGIVGDVINPQISNYIFLKRDLNDQAIIKNVGDDEAVCMLPIDLLFSERTEDLLDKGFGSKWEKFHKKWSDIPFISLIPHRKLFEFFQYGIGDVDVYCEWCHDIFELIGHNYIPQKNDIIENKYQQFVFMQSQINGGMDYFLENPCIAKWNAKGKYWNLSDGHHRAMFLYLSGMRRIPVRVKWDDYKKYRNEDSAGKVMDLLREQKRMEYYQPIENPYFYDIVAIRDGFVKSRIHFCMEHFAYHRWDGKKVLDIGANMGAFGRMFSRLGAEVCMVEPDEKHAVLAMALNNLLGIKCRLKQCFFEDFESEVVYDVAVLLTVIYHYRNEDIKKKTFFEKLNRYVKDAIIWESGDDPDREKKEIIERTKFTNFHHMCSTYATGKVRVLGYFSVS